MIYYRVYCHMHSKQSITLCFENVILHALPFISKHKLNTNTNGGAFSKAISTITINTQRQCNVSNVNIMKARQ